MKTWEDRFLVKGFIAFIMLISLLLLLLPDKHFSELENRRLQPVPRFTWDKLLSKEYGKEVETYVSDHFPFRNQWVQLKSRMERLRLQNENNGIYLGKEGYLFEKFPKPNPLNLHQSVKDLNEFAEQHKDVRMSLLLIPTSVGVYPEKLPWLASSYSQEKVIQEVEREIDHSITFLDGYKILAPHRSESIYYRTDHHWTTYGAYLGYEAYAKKMGWNPLSEHDFKIQTVSDSFLGSYQTRSQFGGLTADSIQVYLPRNPVQAQMEILDTNQTFPRLYDKSFLHKKDQYSYFLGGVHALMKIESQLKPKQIQEKKLLVIKDSFAHCFIPFLANHVPEIYVIDPRYYNGNISEFMTANGIKDVLFLFNTTSFVE